jgi:hypothetical protein
MKPEFNLNDCPKDENGHWLCRTRDGREAVIYTRVAPGAYPLIGTVDDRVYIWRHDGTSLVGYSKRDLITPPRTVTVKRWAHLVEEKLEDKVYFTQRQATGEVYFPGPILAAKEIEITFTIGEGVEP